MMSKLYVFFITLFVVNTSLAISNWISLNAKENRRCSSANPCILSQSKIPETVSFMVNTKKDGEMLVLEKVVIEGKSKQSFSKFENFPKLFENETIGVFATDLNNDGYQDLALQAARSLKNGYSYFYWIYNPNTHKFVQTLEQIEALAPFGKNQLKARGTEELYVVNADFQIVPVEARK